MNYLIEYKSKLVSAEEAVKAVKSGDRVMYGSFAMSPTYLDGFLAKRKDELRDVKVIVAAYPGPLQVAIGDSTREHFVCNSMNFGPSERFLQDKGLCSFLPILLHEVPILIERSIKPDVAILKVAPIDKNGYFNFSVSNNAHATIVRTAKKVIVEVNNSVPYCYGGTDEAVHISDVDLIVESDNQPLMQIPTIEANDIDKAVASHVMGLIEDEAVIQLGIGAMPNTVGSMIANSDLKNLGGHTEMLVDAYVDMIEAGVLNSKNKAFDKGKIPYTFAFGSQRLYDYIDHNPMFSSYPPNYVTNPSIVAKHDKFTSINNAIEVDLFGQISSESSGVRQISGTGGQLDLVYGAFHSKGGKSIICLSSVKEGKEGRKKSRIVPTLSPGTVVSVPRTMTNYVISEYGAVDLKGKSVWERAELLISIAHPELQDELIKEAEKMKIWFKSNKLV